MRHRPTLPLTLAASALLLGAALAAALAPLPTAIGSSPGLAAGEGGSGGNETQVSNETQPRNETKPPANETKPPANETKPPKNDTGPLPAPDLSPENQSVSGTAGAAVAFELVLTNPAKDPQSVSLTTSAPVGWSVRLGSSAYVEAGESVVLHGTVSSMLPGRGVVTVTAQGAGGSDTVSLDVCFAGLLQSCPAGNATGGNGTKPPANETKPPRNDTKPPANETKPPGNETQPPQDGTMEASSPAGFAAGPGPLLVGPPEAARAEAYALGAPAPSARDAASPPVPRLLGEPAPALV